MDVKGFTKFVWKGRQAISSNSIRGTLYLLSIFLQVFVFQYSESRSLDKKSLVHVNLYVDGNFYSLSKTSVVVYKKVCKT